jgi:hypothetical protein
MRALYHPSRVKSVFSPPARATVRFGFRAWGDGWDRFSGYRPPWRQGRCRSAHATHQRATRSSVCAPRDPCPPCSTLAPCFWRCSCGCGPCWPVGFNQAARRADRRRALQHHRHRHPQRQTAVLTRSPRRLRAAADSRHHRRLAHCQLISSALSTRWPLRCWAAWRPRQRQLERHPAAAAPAPAPPSPSWRRTLSYGNLTAPRRGLAGARLPPQSLWCRFQSSRATPQKHQAAPPRGKRAHVSGQPCGGRKLCLRVWQLSATRRLPTLRTRRRGPVGGSGLWRSTMWMRIRMARLRGCCQAQRCGAPCRRPAWPCPRASRRTGQGRAPSRSSGQRRPRLQAAWRPCRPTRGVRLWTA